MSSRSKAGPAFVRPQAIEDVFMSSARRPDTTQTRGPTSAKGIDTSRIQDLKQLLTMAPAPQAAPEAMVVDEAQMDRSSSDHPPGGSLGSKSSIGGPPLDVLNRLLKLDPMSAEEPALSTSDEASRGNRERNGDGAPLDTDGSDFHDAKVNEMDLFVALGGWQSSINLVGTLEKHLSSLRSALASERQALQSLIHLQSQVYDQIGQLDGAIWARSIMECDTDDAGGLGKGKERDV